MYTSEHTGESHTAHVWRFSACSVPEEQTPPTLLLLLLIVHPPPPPPPLYPPSSVLPKSDLGKKKNSFLFVPPPPACFPDHQTPRRAASVLMPRVNAARQCEVRSLWLWPEPAGSVTWSVVCRRVSDERSSTERDQTKRKKIAALTSLSVLRPSFHQSVRWLLIGLQLFIPLPSLSPFFWTLVVFENCYLQY